MADGAQVQATSKLATFHVESFATLVKLNSVCPA
jgi:hypothetical protein